MVHRNFEGHFLVEHPAGKKENDEERRDAILSFSRPSEAEKEQNCFPKMTSTVNSSSNSSFRSGGGGKWKRKVHRCGSRHC